MRRNGKRNGFVKLNYPDGPALSIADLVDDPAFPAEPSLPPEASAPTQAALLPLRHFRLRSHPFSDNVNPEFFFRTESHEEAFLRMKRCIEDDISLGLTNSVSGAGKTLLTQILMQELDNESYRPVLVLVYPGMTRASLLQEILEELEVRMQPGARMTIYTMLSAIQKEIIRLHREGRKAVIIIDESHFLRADSLHILRTLSNIEIPERKLVTLLLFGEESFMEKVEHPQFRSLFSRIFERATLRPLSRAEVEQYVKFRCLMAGGGPSLFGADTFDRIHRLSGGIPREINRVCYNALSAAARRGMIRVGLEALE